MDNDNAVRAQPVRSALLKDIDAVEINRCVRLDDHASGECTIVWPEDEDLPDDGRTPSEPFYTVFLHYRPGGYRHGLEALCDCPSSAYAGLCGGTAGDSS